MAVATAFPVASMAAVNFFDPVTGAPPQTLGGVNGLGIYTDISAKTADTALKYFEVNAALWSDGAAKKRWIVLKPGTRITYVDTTDAFDYPEGAMFVKNFYLDSIAGDSTTRRYWETRILVNKHEGGYDKWHGFTYKWRKDQSNADLVSIGNGLDTVFYYHPNGASKPQTYKKWRFPSQQQCIECHKQGTNDLGSGVFSARGVLGFLPAQLKRAAPLQPGINQVNWLADQGVFHTPLPGNINYARRWKGLSEPIPTTLSADERFKVVDSMARSYIAANCSGCHSTRNFSFGGPSEQLNYDWYDLKPKVEFGALIWNNVGTHEEGWPGVTWPDIDANEGRVKYVISVQKAGMASNPFWTMTLPGQHVTPTLVTPGFPSVSPLLYRQFAKRRTSWRDSLSMYNKLTTVTMENPIPDPKNLKSWLFVNPWGSVAWRADLAAHGIKVDSLMTAEAFYRVDGSNPMPPLATNLPDTAAMRVLGEWAGNYRTLVQVPGEPIVSRVNGKLVLTRAEMPQLRNRILVVPNGWTGKAQMFSVTGRAYALPSAGRGQYAVPMSAPAGVYLFRVGDRTFRASILK